MSAWPQAIWVVKKIQKSFNYIYDNIENDIEALQHKDTELENAINNIEGSFNVAVADFIDKKKTTTDGKDVPASDDHKVAEGTVWFVQQNS